MKIRLFLTLSMLLIIHSAYAISACDANDGLTLLNKPAPNMNAIQEIVTTCEKTDPDNGQLFLLKGLIARKKALISHNYNEAIINLQKARWLAGPHNDIPALELAVTYEWARKFDQAQKIYENILKISPDSRPALLGLARVHAATNAVPAASSLSAPTALSSFQKMLTGCEANKGLDLVNQNKPDFAIIKNILALCDKMTPNNWQVLLLHGLVARKEGQASHHFIEAIEWFKKANAVVMPDNPIPALELANTYYWNQSFDDAKNIYTSVLLNHPNLRAALLGMANIDIAQKKISDAEKIYQIFLAKNPQDIDALNGMARIHQINTQQKKVSIVSPCQINQGFIFLNQDPPPFIRTKAILQKCDKIQPHDEHTFLLHGLLARKEAGFTHQYAEAILWLQKAIRVAPLKDFSPAIELAVTYEWAGKPQRAQAIYEEILAQNPQYYPALLGAARVALQEYRIKDAEKIYSSILQKKPHDVEALNGLGQVKLTNKEFPEAKKYFTQALLIDPTSPDSIRGLHQLQDSTRYILTTNAGRYSIGKASSYNNNVNFYADLNATDQLITQYAHNSEEIQLGSVLTPTVLPKNSYLIGFQRQIPNKYGWGLYYEFRQHLKLNTEYRIGANANLFVLPNWQWLVGVREALPSPWNSELYYLGTTLYTPLPFNVSVTGFLGEEQIGGQSRAYSFDLNKEFSTKTFYDLGAAYSTTQKSWEIHGRLILMIFKNSGLEAYYSHYYFNDTTVGSIGWRIYF